MSELETSRAQAIWENVLPIYRSSLKSEADLSRMDRYFPSFVSKRIVGEEFQIGVPEEIQVEWFGEYFAARLTETMRRLGERLTVKFVVDRDSKPILPKAVEAPAPVPHPSAGAGTRVETPVRANYSTLPLHENYTFANFVRGPSNSFAHAAATAVANAPGGNTYNPLFIWGGTGLGKTHLMEAIGHKVLEDNPNASVCYVTSETFLNEYINAIANDSLPAFRQRYRKADVLLVDDIQFIANKKQFQEEFFNTFNDLLIWHKQIVMTSDIAPRDMHGLEERLTGRFAAGMVVEIESPSYETRLAILKSKAQGNRHPIREDILQFIAENISSHVRALEGALYRVITYREITPNAEMNVEVARHLLKDYIDEEQTIRELTIEEIMQNVAEYYGVTIKDIKSPDRTASLVTPRQMAMFFAHKLTTKSLTEIGAAFEKKHTTVLYGATCIKKRIDVDAEIKKAIEEITSRLGRKISDVIKSDVLK